MELILLLLAAALLFVLYRGVRSILQQYQCPDEEVLEEFYQGRIRDGALKRRIISHLGVCRKCQEKITHFQ